MKQTMAKVDNDLPEGQAVMTTSRKARPAASTTIPIPLIYDITLDSERLATQKDIDLLESMAIAFGLMLEHFVDNEVLPVEEMRRIHREYKRRNAAIVKKHQSSG